MSYLVYDYRCDNCDKDYLDHFVYRTAVDEQTCGECGKPLRRKVPGPITNFKFGDRSAIKSKKAVSLRDPH